MTHKLHPILWLDGARGVYVPRDFVERFFEPEKRISGVQPDTLDILRHGPDHDDYWEAWCDLTDNAVVTDLEGNRFWVYQNEGDFWLIPQGMQWSETEDWFVWEEDEVIEPEDQSQGDVVGHDDERETP